MTQHIKIVDQLRGLAALSVAWFHLTNTYHNWVSTTGSLGWLGVDAFFVISGFVIPYSLSQTSEPYVIRDFPRFLARRFVRLEPPYLASIALVVVATLLSASSPMFKGPSPEFHLAGLAAHFLYLVPLTSFVWLQPVYWTLAYEFGFYLAMGVIFPVVGRGSRPWAARAFATGVIVLVAIGAIPSLVLLFLMGFLGFRRIALQDGPIWTALLLVASTLTLGLIGGVEKSVVGLVTLLAIISHKYAPEVAGRFGATLNGLGAISYSLYLVHIPVGSKIVNLGARFIGEPALQLLLSLTALAASLAAALIFYWVIERPAIRLSRLIRTNSKPKDAPAASRPVS